MCARAAINYERCGSRSGDVCLLVAALTYRPSLSYIKSLQLARTDIFHMLPKGCAASERASERASRRASADGD